METTPSDSPRLLPSSARLPSRPSSRNSSFLPSSSSADLLPISCPSTSRAFPFPYFPRSISPMLTFFFFHFLVSSESDNKVNIIGDGKADISFTARPDVASFLAHILTRKLSASLPPFPFLSMPALFYPPPLRAPFADFSPWLRQISLPLNFSTPSSPSKPVEPPSTLSLKSSSPRTPLPG